MQNLNLKLKHILVQHISLQTKAKNVSMALKELASLRCTVQVSGQIGLASQAGLNLFLHT